MHIKSLVRIAFALVSLLAVAGVLSAFQKEDGGGWQSAKPGPEHALLEQWKGRFETTFTLLAPGAPKLTSKGTSKNELGFGGLWLTEDFDDPNYMGSPFKGHSILGYDAAKKKYVGVWIDSTESRLSLSEGTWDEATKTLTMVAEGFDPYSKKPTQDRTITRIVDRDHYVVTMRSKSEGREEIDIFTIEYARKP